MMLCKTSTIILLLICLTRINAQNLQDSTTITGINIQGNRRTHHEIILRELTLLTGKSYPNKTIREILEQNRLNILKTSLFNFAEVTLDQSDSIHAKLSITVQERWYYIPKIRIKTVEENFNAWFYNKNFNHITTAMMISDENFRGYNEKLTLAGSLGFNKSAGITYFKPSVFNLKQLGMGADIQISSNQEASFGLFDYKPRYTRSTSNSLTKSIQGTLQFYYRPNLAVDELLTIGYHYTYLNDSLMTKNKTYYPLQTQHLIRLTSKLKIDFRDYKAYPLHGSYFDLIAEKAINAKPSGQNLDFNALTTNFRFYTRLSDNLFAAIGGTLLANSGNSYMPFYNKSIGQSGLEMRSFEQYLIPVHKAAILRTTMKYRLLNNPKKVLQTIGNPKFSMIHYALYGTIFADGAAIDLYREANYEQLISIDGPFLYSAGAGFDFSTYYDLVFRTEYSYNFALNKHVFAIHFKASI